jgi:RNA polymerase sigma factor (sigma-70 family)
MLKRPVLRKRSFGGAVDLPPSILSFTKNTGHPIIDKYGPMIESIVKDLYACIAHPHIKEHYVDLQQVARLAFLEALSIYDQSRGVRLSTFTYTFVRNALLKYLRTEYRYHFKLFDSISYNSRDQREQSNDTDINGSYLVGDQDVDFSRIEEAQLAYQVQGFVTTLSERQQAIVRQVFWDGLSKSDVARLYGISPNMVGKILKQVATKGKDYFHENPLVTQ